MSKIVGWGDPPVKGADAALSSEADGSRASNVSFQDGIVNVEAEEGEGEHTSSSDASASEIMDVKSLDTSEEENSSIVLSDNAKYEVAPTILANDGLEEIRDVINDLQLVFSEYDCSYYWDITDDALKLVKALVNNLECLTSAECHLLLLSVSHLSKERAEREGVPASYSIKLLHSPNLDSLIEFLSEKTTGTSV